SGNGEPSIVYKVDTPEEEVLEVPTDGLVGWYPLDAGDATDSSVHKNNGMSYDVKGGSNRYGIEDKATRFDGLKSYIEVADQDYLSISTTGAITISVWMQVISQNFPTSTIDNYIHWLGKGVGGQHEYALRMYDQDDSKNSNRVSAYVFNLTGGLGAGRAFQEPLALGEWLHIVAVYDYPNDAIRIYKNAKHDGESTFASFNITPENGTAPFRIGTRDLTSYLKGVLDDLRVYNRVLTDEEIYALYKEQP